MPELNYEPNPVHRPPRRYPMSVLGRYTGRIPRPGGGGSSPSACIITTSSLANGTDGTPYSAAITADVPSMFATVSGSVPDGLTLNSDGTITGTPTLANTYVFTAEATPIGGNPSCTKELSITIIPQEPPGIDPESFPGLIQWLDAFQYEGLPNATPVGGAGLEWDDLSGNNNDGTTGDGSVEFRSAGIAGTHPSLFFTGTSLICPGITLNGDFTIIVIAETGGDTSWLGNNAANVQVRRRRSGVNNASFFPGSAPEVISDGFGSADGDLVMIVWRRSGTTVSFRENKTDRNSGTNGGGFTYNRIGLSQFVGGIGDCGEIAVYDQFLDDTDLDSLYDNYAQPKWPLP